ncbi:MAG: copper amine oxidase N-terminal domain-containing protein [Oscillospiraceae bacterium]|nr:copper amine oxidase N-terminal domain-containing protein [Oscillospiraceae bacterium]
MKKRMLAIALAVVLCLALVPTAGAAGLSDVDYYGDASICAMSSRMAQAYAWVLDSADKDWKESPAPCGKLLDIAGDGLPVLLVARFPFADYGCYVYEYRDGQAKKVGYVNANVCTGSLGDKPAVCLSEYYPYAEAGFRTDTFYSVSGGKLTLVRTFENEYDDREDDAADKRAFYYSVDGKVTDRAGYEKAWNALDWKLKAGIEDLIKPRKPEANTSAAEYASVLLAYAEGKAPKIAVDGKAVQWTDAVPFIDGNDRTLVPLRAVGDALGLQVEWNGPKREAVFTDGVKTLRFPIDSKTALNGDGETAVEMDTAAIIFNDRTYAPVRYLAEYFGHTVDWDGSTGTVIIK